MVDDIPKSLKSLWDKWNVRGFILVSFFLQTFLIFFASSRKRSARRSVGLLIWLAYLLADWGASFTIGLISQSQEDSYLNTTSSPQIDLLVLWSASLLLHLGGPDTITAFAIEDNELWFRQLFGLFLQAFAWMYVFVKSMPNRVWVSAMLISVSGIIRYAERVRALYLASQGKLRESVSTAPELVRMDLRFIERYGKSADSEAIPENLTDVQIVKCAYRYYHIFKGLVVDLIFTFRERKRSRDFFHKRTAEDTLRILELELSFIYENLYTKVQVLHSWIGTLFRAISFCSLLVAVSLFHNYPRSHLEKIDVGITYALLVGGLVLDLISIIMFFFSDWTLATVLCAQKFKIESLLQWYFRFRRLRWVKYKSRLHLVEHQLLVTPFIFRRWSGSIPMYNLVAYFNNTRPEKLHDVKCCMSRFLKATVPWFKMCDGCAGGIRFLVGKMCGFLGLKDFWDNIAFSSSEPLTKELWEFIFTELKDKSMAAEDPETTRSIYLARGEWVLRNKFSINETGGKLLDYVLKADFQRSLLSWHIATELLFQTEDTSEPNCSNREFSKVLSDYMVYLLMNRPEVFTAAGIRLNRLNDTIAEAKRFLEDRGCKDVKETCEAVLAVRVSSTLFTALQQMDHEVCSESLLFDSCVLAKELVGVGGEAKWEVISRVWVELLCYAAVRCDARIHVQQLTRGGELITFVWLLMAHFGLGEKFQLFDLR